MTIITVSLPRDTSVMSILTLMNIRAEKWIITLLQTGLSAAERANVICMWRFTPLTVNSLYLRLPVQELLAAYQEPLSRSHGDLLPEICTVTETVSSSTLSSAVQQMLTAIFLQDMTELLSETMQMTVSLHQ